LILGKPEDLAEELTIIEEKSGEDVAQKVVAQYKVASDAVKASGITIPAGTSLNGEGMEDTDPFEDTISAYAEANKVTNEVALAQLSSSKPMETQAYMRRMNGRAA